MNVKPPISGSDWDNDFVDEPEFPSLPLTAEEWVEAVTAGVPTLRDYGPSIAGDELRERIAEARRRVRAQRGELFLPRNSEMFRRIVDFAKNPDRECCLKNHFLGCAREVVGRAEALIQRFNNPQRFIFPRCEDFVENASKSALSGRAYGTRQVTYALQLAREVGAFSPSFRWQHRTGFVVTPHDCLCRRENNKCTWVGPFIMPGSFVITPHGVVWRSSEGDAVSFAAVAKRGG